MIRFLQNSSATLATRILRLLLGLGTSVLIARLLGPAGKGVYAMSIFFSLFLSLVLNLGLAPASAYCLAGRRYPARLIFGNNVIISSIQSIGGIIVGFIIILFFQPRIFPSVPASYLYFSLLLIPGNLFFIHIQAIFLGLRDFKRYNLAEIIRSGILLFFITIFLSVFGMDIRGALTAGILAWSLSALLLYLQAYRAAGGISFQPGRSYLKKVFRYGIQVHLGNLLAFLNYRFDLLLINLYINSAAVGFYSIGVIIAEQLSLAAGSVGVVLFPRIAAEKNNRKMNQFTPRVVRVVFFLTIPVAIILFILARQLIILLYSRQYLPAVEPLRVLLPGIVALSASRLIANDIAARGKPVLNTYTALGTLIVNIILNVLWIPTYGIMGAAGASSLSYMMALIAHLEIYRRLSGNNWRIILIPRWEDFNLFWSAAIQTCRRRAKRGQTKIGGGSD